MDVAGRMLLFARVVEAGSFSAAARSLEQSPSAVSKQISGLEDHLGVRLIQRSTRRMTLTEEGHALYERCHHIASEVSEAESLVSAMGESPRGTLRVTATVAFAKAHLLPVIPEFLKRHPDLHVHLELTDRSVDFSAEEIDVAIRFTEQVDDDTVIARKLAHNRRIVCAAPAYLAAFGTPETPDELGSHNCLRLSTVSRWNEWRFDEGGAPRVIDVQGNFEANSADAVYRATLAGLGIARLSTYLVGEDIRRGRLVRILPDYMHEEADILAIYPSRRNLSPRVRVFLDFLAEQLGPAESWAEVPEPVPGNATAA